MITLFMVKGSRSTRRKFQLTLIGSRPARMRCPTLVIRTEWREFTRYGTHKIPVVYQPLGLRKRSDVVDERNNGAC